jgi:GTPase involved in cell partitioning and DNA repair
VSLENEKPMTVYKQIRKELGAYDKTLLEKDEVIVLTKTDMMSDPKKIEKIKKEFEKLGKPVMTLTLYDDASVKEFMKELSKLLKGK